MPIGSMRQPQGTELEERNLCALIAVQQFEYKPTAESPNWTPGMDCRMRIACYTEVSHAPACCAIHACHDAVHQGPTVKTPLLAGCHVLQPGIATAEACLCARQPRGGSSSSSLFLIPPQHLARAWLPGGGRP
jgi:hypothetical protein